MKYLVMCKVYTDVCGIKQLYDVCPRVRKIIHSLKLVDYLHVQADNQCNNYYIILFGVYIYYVLATDNSKENLKPGGDSTVHVVVSIFWKESTRIGQVYCF